MDASSSTQVAMAPTALAWSHARPGDRLPLGCMQSRSIAAQGVALPSAPENWYRAKATPKGKPVRELQTSVRD